MRTSSAAIGTVAFAVTVPATVIGALPRWLARGREPPPAPATQRHLGTALCAAGLPLVADAFVRFVRARGTPAPVAETEELVTSGPYRWVRNPQYVGVIATVAGRGLRWNSRPVLAYAGYLVVAFHTWVRRYEEPRLHERFGAAYEAYAASVPRWPRPLPRATASRSRSRSPSG
jgi:protein-S-isoprenylcysteine O-methyltransferase Ste14